MKKIYGLTVLLMMMCVAMPVFGGVISMSNVTLIPPPASVLVGALESNTAVTGFAEQTDFVIPGGVGVDITTPGAYVNSTLLSPGWIGAGSMGNVYYLHFDPVGNPSPTQANLTGSITFAEKILGIQALSATLVAGNVLGNTSVPTIYNGIAGSQGLEFANTLPVGFTQFGDTITLSPDGMTASWNLYSAAGVDDIRIITVVPEPATGLLLLPGLAALALFRRRRLAANGCS